MTEPEKMNIQWYPGHMTKTRRQMEADLKQVDAVCEIVDARIPISSRNPDIDSICGSKPRILVLNRMDLADPDATQKWAAYFRSKGMAVIATDCKTRRGIADFTPAARAACAEKLQRDAARGMNRPLRVMVVGIPNVGKSTFINSYAGKAVAKTGNKPGVTKGKQWIRLNKDVELLDTPGILWPKFEDQTVGLRLALVGAMNDQILNIDELAISLIDCLKRDYPGVLTARYEVDEQEENVAILYGIAAKRMCVGKGGEIDYSKAAALLIDEFRSGALGRITLDRK